MGGGADRCGGKKYFGLYIMYEIRIKKKNDFILKASFPEIPLFVDPYCCAGVTPESHRNALEAMKMCQIKIREAD